MQVGWWFLTELPPHLHFAPHSHNVPPPPRHSEAGRGNPNTLELGRRSSEAGWYARMSSRQR